MSATRSLFITFHCGDPYYARKAAELQGRCAALGVPMEISAAPDQGWYWHNTLHKPIFIRERLAALRRDLIWNDADTLLHRDAAAFHALSADVTLATRPVTWPASRPRRSGWPGYRSRSVRRGLGRWLPGAAGRWRDRSRP